MTPRMVPYVTTVLTPGSERQPYAWDGVLASAAAELFQEFDADGDGTVDFEEFQELSAKVKDLKGSMVGLYKLNAVDPLRSKAPAWFQPLSL
jgi:hypothetical protein